MAVEGSKRRRVPPLCSLKIEVGPYTGYVSLNLPRGSRDLEDAISFMRDDAHESMGIYEPAAYLPDAEIWPDATPLIEGMTCKGYFPTDSTTTPRLALETDKLLQISMVCEENHWHISGFYAVFQDYLNSPDDALKREASEVAGFLKGVGRRLLCECIACILKPDSPFVGIPSTPITLFASGFSASAYDRITEDQFRRARALHPGKSDHFIKSKICHQGLVDMYKKLGFRESPIQKEGRGTDMESTLLEVSNRCLRK